MLRDNWATILIVCVFLAGYLLLRTIGDDVASAAAFDAQIADGLPVLVEFYSNT